MYQFRYLIVVTLATLIGACANTDYFAPTPAADPENAVVYLYRPAASNPGKKPLTTSYPEIMVDDRSVGLLKYRKHLRIELPAGSHKFVATGLTPEARWEPENREYTLRVEAGGVYYMRFRVEFNTDNMSLGSFRGQYIIHLHPVDGSEAIYQIRETSA